ncbi:MAG: hypothetical protein NTU80_07120 [Verrucomicrobia bacterium]|nr:hypothetical protein [Verrucomicrobiota bacterium]
MSQDPHAQLDQSVLDMIELSPVGAVPHTPTYQDALRRLYASHQVYASADCKDGHVTVRKVALQPAFFAANLDALTSGKIPVAELESNGPIFDRYVQSLPAVLQPKAETHRAKAVGRSILHRKHTATAQETTTAVHDPMHSLFLVPGAGPRLGLPGNYLYGAIMEFFHPDAPTTWRVQLHDAEDGSASLDSASLAAALGNVQELLAAAPFHLSEVVALGFKID